MAEKLTLTIGKWIELHELLQQLDAHVELTTGPDGKLQRGKTTPYTFEFKARYAIIRNLPKLADVVKAFNTERDNELLKLTDGATQLEPSDPEYKAKIVTLQKWIDEKAKEEIEIAGLLKIPFEALNLDKNPLLPNTLVATLDPLISYPAEQPAAA